MEHAALPKLPRCPHCGSPLTTGELRSLVASVRSSSNRKKPRARETIVPILQFLQSDPADHKLGEIFAHVTRELSIIGMEPKRIATGFALTWLAREGVVSNVRHGHWQITAEGMRIMPTLEFAQLIEKKHDPAFNQQKVLKP